MPDEAPIRLFEMGSNRWRTFASWPETNRKSYFLSSTGLASISESEGTLSVTPSDTCLNDVLVHDPWRPVPALGGHAAVPAGSFERSHLDGRLDVLTYTTEPLVADLHLAGDVAVEVWCTADMPSHDLCAVLSQVCSDDSSYNLTQGYIHVESTRRSAGGSSGGDVEQAQAQLLRVSLQATCVRIAKGNALRLSLSAACFPAYAMNPGTGSMPSTTHLMEAQIVTLTVSCGGDRPSQVLLPMISQL